jgi:hypothetical protein
MEGVVAEAGQLISMAMRGYVDIVAVFFLWVVGGSEDQRHVTITGRPGRR